MTTRLVLATANPGKAAEIREILGDGVEVAPRPDTVPDVVEDADSLEGNARLKAVAIADATGDSALADDTGLEVDALGGAPGVHSARFRTVVLLHRPDGSELVAEGVVEGTIALDVRGDGGFGYDSLFVPDDGNGRTFAEMSPHDKNRISHRGRALRALARLID